MKRWILRILLLLLILLILIPLGVYLGLKTDAGQARAASFISQLLTKELGTPVQIGHVDFNPMDFVGLDDVLVLDHHDDTLLYAVRAEGDIGLFELGAKQLKFDALRLDEGLFRMRQYVGEDQDNLTLLINRINASTSGNDPWEVAFGSANVHDMRIERLDDRRALAAPGLVDATHLYLSQVHAEIHAIELISGGVSLEIAQLSAQERAGLSIEQFQGGLIATGDSLALHDIKLKTGDSDIIGDIHLSLPKEKRGDMRIEVTLSESNVSVRELGYFIPGYEQLQGHIGLNAEIRGTLDDLLLRDALLTYGNSSRLYLDGRVTGLPDIDQLHIAGDVRRLESSLADLYYLPLPDIATKIEQLPSIVERFGQFDFTGGFDGTLQDFSSSGSLGTEVGNAVANLEVHLGDSISTDSYLGHVILQEFNLGKLLDNPSLGYLETELDVEVAGSDADVKAKVAGAIASLEYKGYTYRDISIDGDLEQRLFNGLLSIRQPEVDLDFKGLVDFRAKRPKFDFEASLYQADFGALGIASDMDSTSITGKFYARFEGDRLDDFEGRIVGQGLSYCRRDEEFYFKEFSLSSQSNGDDRILELSSTPVNGLVQGNFKFSQIKDDFIGLFDEVMPSLFANETHTQVSRGTALTYTIEFKDNQQLLAIFAPDARLSTGTRISGLLDADAKRFTMKLDADSIGYQGVQIQDMQMEMERVADVAYLAIESRDMTWGDSLRFEDNYYTFNAYRDTIETDFTWALPDREASGNIAALSLVHSRDSIDTYLYPSQMVLSGDYWMTQGESHIAYHNSKIKIDEAMLSNGKETIRVAGVVGKGKEDRLDFDVIAFELDHINNFLPAKIIDFQGITELDGYATGLLSEPTIVADLSIIDFSLGGERIGDIAMQSTWNKGEEFLNLLGGLRDDDTQRVLIDGRYYPSAAVDNFDAHLTFDAFDLGLVDKIPISAISGLGGRAYGSLQVKGAALEPDITGTLRFEEATVKIDYLNTAYTFSSEVVVEKDFIGTNYIDFTDKYGNGGKLNATVAHENFREWNYDLYAEFSKLLVLDTDANMNDLFYGKIFGSGSVSLSGYKSLIDIEVYGSTDKGTTLSLPLGGSDNVELDEFVYFKRSAEEDSLLALAEVPTTGLNLFIEADVDEDAQLKLIFDEQIGDVMEGRGLGTLTMTLDRAGEFEMYGNYLISQGEYLFTLQNVVNKRFEVKPGSSVAFYGDPLQAELDLETVYNLRASLADLLPQAADQATSRVSVETIMALQGPLLNPDISFGIEFPGLDARTTAEAKSQLNTDEELNRQVFSLLVLNKFLSSDATVEDGISGAANATSAEFASAQLSNWLSQISDDVDIGVNYRAADNLNSEELAVALTTQLFNDRLLLSGNFGVQGANSTSVNSATSVIGDFRLEYFITRDGKLRLKVFSETNDNTVLTLGQTANQQGVGLVFQRDFDGLFNDGKLSGQ